MWLTMIKWFQWLLSLFPKVINYLRTWKFKRIFGKDVGKLFYIIYNEYKNPNLNTVFPKPESQVNRSRGSGGTNLTTVNSCATVRAIAHLVYGIGSVGLTAPKIVSDIEFDEKMELSFVSIGGITNFKTVDLLDNNSNKFLEFGKGAIISKSSRKKIVIAGSELGFDHGFIIKVRPNNSINRTWICCAGFAEWATSGAAWYLAHKWKEIHKWAKKSDFAIIVKTKKGSDESTILLYKFVSSEEIESCANQLNFGSDGAQHITTASVTTRIQTSAYEEPSSFTTEPPDNLDSDK